MNSSASLPAAPTWRSSATSAACSSGRKRPPTRNEAFDCWKIALAAVRLSGVSLTQRQAQERAPSQQARKHRQDQTATAPPHWREISRR